jgi:hypothetical protein
MWLKHSLLASRERLEEFREWSIPICRVPRHQTQETIVETIVIHTKNFAPSSLNARARIAFSATFFTSQEVIRAPPSSTMHTTFSLWILTAMTGPPHQGSGAEAMAVTRFPLPRFPIPAWISIDAELLHHVPMGGKHCSAFGADCECVDARSFDLLDDDPVCDAPHDDVSGAHCVD